MQVRADTETVGFKKSKIYQWHISILYGLLLLSLHDNSDNLSGFELADADGYVVFFDANQL